MNITVDAADIRIDKYLAEEIEILSRTKVKDYITKDNVLVDGSSVKPSYLLRGARRSSLRLKKRGHPAWKLRIFRSILFMKITILLFSINQRDW